MMDRASVRSHIFTRSITDKLKKKKCTPMYETYVGVFQFYLTRVPLFEIIKFLLKQTSKLKGTLHLPETFSIHGKRALPVLKITLYRPE